MSEEKANQAMDAFVSSLPEGARVALADILGNACDADPDPFTEHAELDRLYQCVSSMTS